MPRLSIVFPCLNSGSFLDAALASVLDQSFEDFELIAIDSASTDGTAETLARNKDPRLRLITLPAPCGIVTPANLGISLATGAYIAFMDSDDVMHRDRLARQVSFLDAHANVDTLGTAFTILSGDTVTKRRPPTGDAQIKAMIPLMNSAALHNPTVMVRARFLRDHGLFYPALTSDHDNALWLAMMKAGATFANLAEDLLTYNDHPASYTSRNAAQFRRGKTPLRAEALLALLPDLTGYEAEAIAIAMEEGRTVSIDQAVAGLLAMERASRIGTCRYGADRETLGQVISASFQRVRSTLEGSLAGRR